MKPRKATQNGLDLSRLVFPDESGAMTLPLPACSPDLNPIEKMWSKAKEILRAANIKIKAKKKVLMNYPIRFPNGNSRAIHQDNVIRHSDINHEQLIVIKDKMPPASYGLCIKLVTSDLGRRHHRHHRHHRHLNVRRRHQSWDELRSH